ncbi:MAG: serine hydrolase [Patescibacteria group bacterium]
MNDFLLIIAIITQLTGLTLPQVIGDEFNLAPVYDQENNLSWHAEPVVNIWPQIDRQTGPRAVRTDIGPGELKAKAAIVEDAATGQILYQKQADIMMPIASITKLMTVLVFLDHNPGWNVKHQMQADENNLEGAKLQIGNGQELTTHDLLRTTLVGSANNTAKALARSTGLSDEEFAAAMNDKAKLLGLTNSKFVEPTGLNAGNQSSVSDLAILFREVLKHQALRDAIILSEHDLSIPPDNHFHAVKSTVKLLSDPEAHLIGGKTGFTYEAGYCLISAANNEFGHTIITATLDLPSEIDRDSENKRLINWAFNNYIWE